MSGSRWEKVQAKLADLERLRLYAKATRYGEVSVAQWIRRPENTTDQIPQEIRGDFAGDRWESLEIELKYAGYITRQEVAIEKLRGNDAKRIPPKTDFIHLPGLREEARQKFALVRPETLGQASRISGITPSDIALLAVYLHRGIPLEE